MKADRYLAPHYAYYVREIKVFMLLYICFVKISLCCIFIFVNQIKFRLKLMLSCWSHTAPSLLPTWQVEIENFTSDHFSDYQDCNFNNQDTF